MTQRYRNHRRIPEDHTLLMEGVQDTTQYPRGEGIYYHCDVCGVGVHSLPDARTQCKCGNICLEPEGGAFTVLDYKRVRVVQVP